MYPAGNDDVAEGLERYRGLLADQTSFATMTLEAMLDADALARATTSALLERYLPG